ncbi:MAG: biopolymer transporter ExbD [Marinilabiliales bacterium]|nr:MAG: biopolymer transporter ExbD [Marinilabiliales bacterium]
MSKFQRKDKGKMPGISTASLPDIVFMLLFFFMVSTTMREVTINVRQRLPSATEVQKLEKRSLVSFIYIGEPRTAFQALLGTEPRIQLNDQFATTADIAAFIASEREARDESEIPFMRTSLKVDNEVRMGIVDDVKQALRRANALNINYSTLTVESIFD